MEKIKLLCNAKINLTLDITSKREDGYHNIDSIMQSVSVADELTVRKSINISVDCSKKELNGEKNIAFKAAKAFFDFTGIIGGADIYIEKHIPDAAGMGGGSADAAGVIIALDKIYKTNLSDEQLCAIAKSVGADVPFCLFGGTKRVKGIGEIISDCPDFFGGAFLIIKKGNKLSTADMYTRLDQIGARSPNTENFVELLKQGTIEQIANNLSNDFEAVCDVKYEKQLLLQNGAIGVCLSGSGPSVYGIFKNVKEAIAAKEKIKDHCIFAEIAIPQKEASVIII